MRQRGHGIVPLNLLGVVLLVALMAELAAVLSLARRSRLDALKVFRTL